MSKFLLWSCIFLCVFATQTFAELKEMANAEEFEQVIANAEVPVLVQFSAYWCGPCQSLKKTMQDVSAEYTDDQILLYYVDAYVNSSLKQYLNGGYPTTVVFSKGKKGSNFVGSKSASFVRGFIDNAINLKVAEENSLIELNSASEFHEKIANSEVPVLVQFSAYWCVPCQRLKEKMKNVAPQYNANEIAICYVDAYKNPELKSYLEGGYPTTKFFRKGKVGSEFFVGDKSEESVKRFIDQIIQVEASAVNALIELKNTEEFNTLISSAKVPVMVQFSAEWCNPCQSLKGKLKNVAAEYSENDILICYVDADINRELQKYVDGAYPTVKVFSNGQVTKGSFIGNKSEKFVKNFIDGIVKDNTQE